MTVTPIVGTTSQPRLTPYLSVAMLKYHSRRGVSFDQLVPRGMPEDQDQALQQYIEDAAAYTDSVCQQILAATYDTSGGRINVSRDGFAYVHPRYRPVIALTAFSIGPTPALMTAYTSFVGVKVEPDYFAVPVGGAGGLPVNTSQGPIQFGTASAPMDQAWAEWTIVNGFPVTFLTASAALGATSISVADTTGIVPGATWLTIYAGADRVRVLAGVVSTAGPAGIGTGPGTVACAALPQAISNVGPQPVMVSALPADVIQANALIVRAFIKESGGGNISGPTVASGQASQANGSGDDLADAVAMLRPYVAPIE